MPSPLGPLRSKIFGTNPSVTVDMLRSFTKDTNPETAAELERVASAVANGIDVAIRSSRNAELQKAFAEIPRQYRGWSYEGAGTGLTALDSITPFGRRAMTMLADAGEFDLTMYVGIGLALARIPKPFWRKLVPPDPLFRWLTLDGYGFYKAFFTPEKYIYGKRIDTRFPRWLGDRAPLLRTVDQGIGRAAWFVAGGLVDRAIELLDAFEPNRRGDLWGGIGIATAFAGGVGGDELSALWEAAGEFQPQVATGAALVAKVRQQTDSVTPHNETAMQIYCGRTVSEAVAVLEEAALALPTDGTCATYQLWRDNLGKVLTGNRTQDLT